MVSIGVSCIKCPVVCSFRPMCWLAGNLLAHIVVAHANSTNTNNIVVVVESPHEGVDAIDTRNNSMNSIDWVHSVHSRDVSVDSITLVVDCRSNGINNRTDSTNNSIHSLVDVVDSRMDVGGNISRVVVVDHRAESVNNRTCSLVDVVNSMVWVGDHLGLCLSRALPI